MRIWSGSKLSEAASVHCSQNRIRRSARARVCFATQYAAAINKGPYRSARLRRVADLSSKRGNWDDHLSEIAAALQTLSKLLIDVRAAGDTAVVDVALYPRTDFAPGVMMVVDSHRFPPETLRLMADLDVILEVTITSMSPD